MPKISANDRAAAMQKSFEPVTKRQFVALVRARLDVTGHHDVAISRQWLAEDADGPMLLNVPVGTELLVPVKAMDGSSHVSDPSVVARHVEFFAEALVNLRKAERMLARYARDVRREAKATIARMRANGLDVMLEGVGFAPSYAHHLAGGDWKDAALHVNASISVRHLSFHLRPEISEIPVEDVSDIAGELEERLGEQLERQELLAELDARGADLEVDALTLDLLAAHALDAADLLRRTWREQCVNLKVRHRGREVDLSLLSFDGRAIASICLGEAHWNGEYLWFLKPDAQTGNADLVGQSLGDRVSHSVFADRKIVEVVDHGADHFAFDLSDTMLFDAESGRIWRDGRLAA